MSQLAPLLSKLKESGAERVFFAPGEVAVAFTGEARRPLPGGPQKAANIVDAVAELLSHDELDDLPTNRARIVRHEHGGEEYVLEIVRQPAGIALGIRFAAKKKLSVREAPLRESFRESLKESIRGAEMPLASEPSPMPGASARPGSRRFRAPGARADKRTVRVELDDEGNPVDAADADELGLKPPRKTAPPPAAQAVRIETKPVKRAGQGSKPAGLDGLLREMLERGASDLHLSTGNPPAHRIDGVFGFVEERAPIASAEIDDLVRVIMSERVRRDFDELRDVDFGHDLDGGARFRVNVFEDRNGMRAVFHRLPAKITTAKELGLPRACLELCQLAKGLVVVTGPPGSGTSTTVAAMLDVVNGTRDGHILTIEDPIELMHANARCLVSQREIGRHTKTVTSGLRAALREDPDVISVGELRDIEALLLTLEAAATRLVFATLRAPTAVSAVERLLARSPPVRALLGESLAGVVAQVLRPKSGGGKAAVYEILLGTPEVSALVHEGKTTALVSIMETSGAEGMITMDDALRAHAKKGPKTA